MEIVKYEKLSLGVADLQILEKAAELAQRIIREAEDKAITGAAGQLLGAVSELQILAE